MQPSHRRFFCFARLASQKRAKSKLLSPFSKRHIQPTPTYDKTIFRKQNYAFLLPFRELCFRQKYVKSKEMFCFPTMRFIFMFISACAVCVSFPKKKVFTIPLIHLKCSRGKKRAPTGSSCVRSDQYTHVCLTVFTYYQAIISEIDIKTT